jgi:hypothetical protein
VGGRVRISGEIVSKPNLLGCIFYSFSWQVVLSGHQVGILMTMGKALESVFFFLNNKLYFWNSFSFIETL